MRWDIFCQVIDNWGDIGVCWRLAADLGARGQQVRLWTDDASALVWMAPQGSANVQVLPWPTQAFLGGVGDVVIEAFGCALPPVFVTAMAEQKPLWLNLEYLSAERYVERCHGLPSPIASGPGAGLTCWFFYPGFTPKTGGLLRERNLQARQNRFDRPNWRAQQGISADTLAVSLFCYDLAALPALLQQLHRHAHLFITPGRAATAVQRAACTLPPATWLPWLTQPAFDELLWACDLNCVRGEDSLVRALWAGQAFIWQIYPQHDHAHHAKLHAFLDWLDAPPSLRQWHLAWNGMESGALPALNAALLAQWRACVQAARARLLAQEDLTGQLMGFVREKSA